MIARELKLKLNRRQKTELSSYLWHLAGIYNWAIRKIELDAQYNIYYSKISFQNILANHSKKLGIPSHTIQGILIQAWTAWNRCFKKISKKPKFKSARNKLNSIPFPGVIPLFRIKKNRINIPNVGSLKFHKQHIPEGKIKYSRIIKRASGWYLQLAIDAQHIFKVDIPGGQVGIDTGFKYLAVLSDGTKIENQRNYLKSHGRLAQAQRGKDKKLVARLHERIVNQRKDYNHKVSRKIVEKYSEIYCTNDNLKGQQKTFGKSISDAGISQLRHMLSYKSCYNGRNFVLVDSRYTTMICNSCGSLTGPTGFAGLSVRSWVCDSCGSIHDRDINASINILNSGVGSTLVSNKGEIQCQI